MSEEITVGAHKVSQGSLNARQLQAELESLWHDALAGKENAVRSAAAETLGASEADLMKLSDPPIRVAPGPAGMTGVELAILAGLWLGQELVVKPLVGVPQDEIKKRLRAFWIDTVMPKIRLRTANQSAVGQDIYMP